MKNAVAMPRAWNIWPKTKAISLTSQASKSSVGKVILEQGLSGYEPETFAVCAALIQSLRMKTFVDIGANIGIYSMTMKAVFGSKIDVHAFEPLPSLAAIVRNVAAQNGLEIAVNEVALSDTTGTATFYVSAKSDTSNSLASGFRRAKDEIQVQVDTLSNALPGVGPDTLIKLDTESTEPNVLEGADAIIAQHRPWVVCEVLPKRTEERLGQFLQKHDYRPYHVTGKGLVPYETIDADLTYENRDWLFAPAAVPNKVHGAFAKWVRAFGRLQG